MRCLFWYVLAHITVGFAYLAYVEIVRAGRIHKRHAFDYIAIFIKTLCPIWEIFLSYWELFHQNWEKYILFFICIGNGYFYGTRIYRQKNPCIRKYHLPPVINIYSHMKLSTTPGPPPNPVLLWDDNFLFYNTSFVSQKFQSLLNSSSRYLCGVWALKTLVVL